LLLITAEGISVHALPQQGQVSIGRAEGNSIRIEDGSVSRRHAVIHVGPSGRLRLEDLGAANGTRVQPRGKSVSPASTESLTEVRRESLPIAEGDRILLGSVTVLVERQTKPSAHMDVKVICDPQMTALYGELERVAGANINVLLLGETGVGKDVLARALHVRSRRASGPFVAFNCAALTPTLLESELFGHERGAFTGAVSTRPGLFEAADGGTLFLDEVGELPLPTQAKLLRVLEDRKVVRLGSRTELSFDARFVAATNRDLEALAETGEFRSDLYFRLATFTLTIPPLRQRPAEILRLAQSFLNQAATELARPAPELSAEASLLLESYGWPGNVRELKNAMQRAVALAQSPTILPEHLPDRVRRASKPAEHGARASDGDQLTRARNQVVEAERNTIQAALERCAGNQTRAAAELGISRRTLVSRLATYNLRRPRG
jgi:DNA-binding NtrC family response regulator